MKRMIFVMCLTLVMGFGLASQGFSVDSVVQEIVIFSDSTWKSYSEPGSDYGQNPPIRKPGPAGWEMRDFDDSDWRNACASYPNDHSSPINYITGTDAVYMWDRACPAPDGENGNMYAWFRRTFYIPPVSAIVKATVIAAADDDFVFYVNGHEVYRDMNGQVGVAPSFTSYTIDVTPYLVPGKNVFAMYAADNYGDEEWALVDAKIQIIASSEHTIYVKKDATGENNGTSWTDAYTDLQAALSATVSGYEIRVSKGVYKPASGTDRTISFNMKNGVKIYGGFAGNETSLSQRNWQTNKTVLSGDIDGNDTVDSAGITTTINGSNSYHVIYNYGNIDSTAVLNGFVIVGGQGYGSLGGGMVNGYVSPTVTNCSFSNNNGSGMDNRKSSPTITNCSFSNNNGSGMNNNSGSSPTITNCFFSNNNGSGMGNSQISSMMITNSSFSNNHNSGMHNELSHGLTITNCSFVSNSALRGGGMSNTWGGNAILINCLFYNNSASADGGGIYSGDASTLKIINSSFSNNSAEKGGGMFNLWNAHKITNSSFSNNSATKNGGAMFNENSHPIINSCSFSDNSAIYAGGGVFDTDHATTTIYNSILWNNGSQIVTDSGSAQVYYSIVKGGWTGIGSNNKSLNPLFVNATVGDLRLQSGSPAINAGNNSYIPVEVTTDLYGSPRISDGTTDMGAYESPSVDINGDGLIDINDISIIKANLNKFASACPTCDLDKDGKITVLDAKKLMNMCSCPNCVCP